MRLAEYSIREVTSIILKCNIILSNPGSTEDNGCSCRLPQKSLNPKPLFFYKIKQGFRCFLYMHLAAANLNRGRHGPNVFRYIIYNIDVCPKKTTSANFATAGEKNPRGNTDLKLQMTGLTQGNTHYKAPFFFFF